MKQKVISKTCKKPTTSLEKIKDLYRGEWSLNEKERREAIIKKIYLSFKK